MGLLFTVAACGEEKDFGGSGVFGNTIVVEIQKSYTSAMAESFNSKKSLSKMPSNRSASISEVDGQEKIE